MIRVFLLAALLAGCQSSGDFCRLTSDHTFADATVDAMTQEEVDRELSFNDLRKERC